MISTSFDVRYSNQKDKRARATGRVLSAAGANQTLRLLDPGSAAKTFCKPQMYRECGGWGNRCDEFRSFQGARSSRALLSFAYVLDFRMYSTNVRERDV